ncbi:MAG: hypothetical protein DHS20C19_11010 [Acidimicrobiales bacterium]|nr:MAG: hypothetical protein DHS20C19_11010 [Acidimicrobiales bacterium]
MSVDEVRRRYIVLLALRWLPVGLVAPIFVLVLSRGASLTQIGPLLAVYGVTTAALELPTGGLADSIGRRPVLLASAFCNLGLFALLLASTDLRVLAVALFLGGVGRALDSGPLESWFVDESTAADADVDVRVGLSRGGAVDGAALAVGSIVGGVIPQLADGRLWATVLLALVLEGVHLVAVFLLMTEEHRMTSERPRSRFGALSNVRTGLGFALRVGSLRRTIAGGAMIGAALVAVEALWQPQFLDLLDRDDATIFLGVLLALGFAGSAVGAAAAPAFGRRMGRRTSPTMSAQLLAGSMLVVLGVVTQPLIAAVVFVLFYAFLGLLGPLRSALLHESTSSGQRSTTLSVDSLLFQAGGAAAALSLTAIADSHGIGVAWIAAGVCLAVSSLLYISSDRADPDRRYEGTAS